MHIGTRSDAGSVRRHDEVGLCAAESLGGGVPCLDVSALGRSDLIRVELDDLLDGRQRIVPGGLP
jgi:hypothetical protein